VLLFFIYPSLPLQQRNKGTKEQRLLLTFLYFKTLGASAAFFFCTWLFNSSKRKKKAALLTNIGSLAFGSSPYIKKVRRRERA